MEFPLKFELNITQMLVVQACLVTQTYLVLDPICQLISSKKLLEQLRYPLIVALDRLVHNVLLTRIGDQLQTAREFLHRAQSIKY